MLSDSPPERDVEWTTAGAEGAWQFLQRFWRLVDGAADSLPEPGSPCPDSMNAEATDLRRATHKAIDEVTRSIEGFTFNKAVARIYELANSITRASQANDPELGFALREALEALVILSSPMVPHLAEECWARLGHNVILAETSWPVAEPELLKDDTITMPIQVNGKRRGELQVPAEASKDEVTALALADESVMKILGDNKPKKIIVVPGRIVNVVI